MSYGQEIAECPDPLSRPNRPVREFLFRHVLLERVWNSSGKTDSSAFPDLPIWRLEHLVGDVSREVRLVSDRLSSRKDLARLALALAIHLETNAISMLSDSNARVEVISKHRGDDPQTTIDANRERPTGRIPMDPILQGWRRIFEELQIDDANRRNRSFIKSLLEFNAKHQGPIRQTARESQYAARQSELRAFRLVFGREFDRWEHERVFGNDARTSTRDQALAEQLHLES